MSTKSSLPSSATTRAMVDFIREHWGEMLGPHAALLDQPGGLDLLAEMVRAGKIIPRRGL